MAYRVDVSVLTYHPELQVIFIRLSCNCHHDLSGIVAGAPKRHACHTENKLRLEYVNKMHKCHLKLCCLVQQRLLTAPLMIIGSLMTEDDERNAGIVSAALT